MMDVSGSFSTEAVVGQRGAWRRVGRWLAVGGSVAFGACHATVYDAVDPVMRVVTPVVWSGTTVVLTCDALVGRDTLPTVLIGSDTAAVTFAAPDTLRVAVPDSQGTYTVWVALQDRPPIPAGSVRVVGGYAGLREVPRVGGFPLQWPGGGLSGFLIAQPSGLTSLDPRTGATTALLPDSVFSQSCVNGPGPAPGGRIVVQGRGPSGCGPFVAFRPDAPGLARDTGPSPSGSRFAAQLGPAVWLITSHHAVTLWSRDTMAVWRDTRYNIDEPYGIAMSPRGDRVAVMAYGFFPGIPVFTTASRQPAYVLSRFSGFRGAQFSDDGDTLFVLAASADTSAARSLVLAALRASDGEVLRATPAWPNAENLVLDPGRPWIYLVGYSDGWSAEAVQVVDRTTLAPLTTLIVPPGAVPPDVDDIYPMLSAAERRLYLVLTCPFCTAGGLTRIIAFDLFP